MATTSDNSPSLPTPELAEAHNKLAKQAERIAELQHRIDELEGGRAALAKLSSKAVGKGIGVARRIYAGRELDEAARAWFTTLRHDNLQRALQSDEAADLAASSLKWRSVLSMRRFFWRLILSAGGIVSAVILIWHGSLLREQIRQTASDSMIVRRAQLLSTIYDHQWREVDISNEDSAADTAGTTPKRPTFAHRWVPVASDRARREAAEAFVQIEIGRNAVVQLSRANLGGLGVEFFGDLRGADFSGAKLGGAMFVGWPDWERDIHRGEDLQRAIDQERKKADLSGANFNEADLHSADLSGARLVGSWFWKANLSEADLSEADLSGANLSEAVLRGADLSEVRFGSALAIHADLSGANLWLTDIRNVNLFGANLTGANLSEAQITDFGLAISAPIRANLRGATISQDGERCVLSQGLLNMMCGDERTQIPSGLTRPAHWATPSPEPEDWTGCPVDENTNGVLDILERDTDGDGTPDAKDDENRNGILDILEDYDGDGRPDESPIFWDHLRPSGEESP